jgi:hypothetical protein
MESLKVLKFNLLLGCSLGNSSFPIRALIKMKRNISRPRLKASPNDYLTVSAYFYIPFHLLTNLNILKSLKALNAVNPLWPSDVLAYSNKEINTTNASNKLNTFNFIGFSIMSSLSISA